MNGYELTIKLRRIRRKYPLTATEQALYHELGAICNEDEWPDIFSCSNQELCNALQLTEKTLIAARLALIQAGLLFYKSGKSRRQFGAYSFTKPLEKKETTGKNTVGMGVGMPVDMGVDMGVDMPVDMGVHTPDYIKPKRKESKVKNTESAHEPSTFEFSHDGFFDKELEQYREHPMIEGYRTLVEAIHGKDTDGVVFEKVLSLKKQIGFNNFLTLRKTFEFQKKRSIRDVLESMDGTKDLAKRYDDVFRTANNWLKNEFEKKVNHVQRTH